MMGKRLLLAAALAMVLTSAGCTRNWCEHHGYYPAQPQPCCVPCCPQPATGYAPAPAAYAPAPAWNQPTCTCAPAPIH